MITVKDKHSYKGAGEYIGRPSVLGNQFSHLDGTLAQFKVATRDEAVSRYHEWLQIHFKSDPAVRTELLRLVDIYERTGELVLICWCAPLACHGDILKTAIEHLVEFRKAKRGDGLKVIIAGSRGISDVGKLERAIENCGFKIGEVVCGDAQGVDTMGAHWAKKEHIPVRHFPANWDRDGKSAGFKRNVEMAQYADAVIALWDGQSHGTKHMIDTMKRLGKHGYIVNCK